MDLLQLLLGRQAPAPTPEQQQIADTQATEAQKGWGPVGRGVAGAMDALPDYLKGLVAGDPTDPDASKSNLAGQATGMAVGLPLWKLANAFKSGLADELMSRAKSPILKQIYAPYDIGSGRPAAAMSGIRTPNSREYIRYRGMNIPDFKVPDADAGSFSASSPTELRAANHEMYGITQKILDSLGIGPDELVDLYRSGGISKQPHILTPTHVDPEYAANWRGGIGGFNKFKVPRTSIQTLVGLLRRGDELTAGEALVPARRLRESWVEGSGITTKEPFENYPGTYQRIPSWFKKDTLKR